MPLGLNLNHHGATSRFRHLRPMLLSAALVLAGCTAPKHSPPAAPSGRAQPTNPTVARPTQSPRKPKPASLVNPARAPDPEPRYPVVTPIVRSLGRVIEVNPQAQFVVLDFSFNPLPQPDQRLNVYRLGQKVGSVRVTGAPRGSLMAADIMSGEARVDDEVEDR